MLRTLDFYIIKTAQHIQGGVFLFASLYPRLVAHAMKCTAHSMADTQRLWAMSLRSILHVSRYDQLSAIQFLAPLLVRSYFLLFLFIERLYSLTVSPCRLLICASALVKQEWFTMQTIPQLPSSISHQSLLSSLIIAQLHLWLVPCITPQTCRALKLTTQGARKNVSARSKMWPSVSRIPLILAEDYREPLERHTKQHFTLWRSTGSHLTCDVV